ncbi:GNAT family N-acetyltransferase [Cytobacillus dafuensis]|uniref:GNAT family N-acetyltransferase n=1 Tax=Cytobacillus dafuensis TaxID=1742359 RepID=A0A5B8Z5J0_CYTDA|nr:GNAT family N-acetyltransferase [Cytobacillus dafuensis]QED48344.1 GNAT family N-acetyltransferase [Cytobacillus dafuensis]
MNQMTNTILIEEYHEGLAVGIAKMWNLSRDSWGGDTRVYTEEQIKLKEANSGNIALYLALDGTEVVGYCGLSEYKEDTGSLYIPLLNVRPDYHGKKIGKMLLMKALNKTIELGWPRLDLYTWPGNVKAVPLYKKCGFFWEDRDDTTHLMNFIPAVFNTPLLKPLFSQLDWYNSSIREIEVKPDAEKENGFTFYEYAWENDQTKARVRFERTGRGISLIETDDYLLELRMMDHEVIEEEAQLYEFKFVNKTDKPVSLKVKGNQHERAIFSLNEELVVDGEAVITNEVVFLQGDEPSAWKTHPYLSLHVEVNGMECELRLGVFPKQPAKITAKTNGKISFLNNKEIIELEIENSLKVDAEFELNFPESEYVQLINSIHYISLKKNERKLIKLPFIVIKFGFYQPTLTCKAKKADGAELSFTNQFVGIALKGFGEKFGGESKEYWHIYNGLCQVNIRKMDYLMTAGKDQLTDQPLAFFVPKLGKPYSTEFSKQKADNIEWYCEKESITFKLEFTSKDFKGISIRLYTSLYGDGIVKKWAVIKNNGIESFRQLYLNQALYHEKSHAYFPIDHHVVEFSNTKYLEFGDIHQRSLTGNWYFSEDHNGPIGFCWPKACTANIDSWQFYLEYELGLLNPGDEVEIEPCILSIGAFRNWQEWEAFVNSQTDQQCSSLISELDLTFEGKSPVFSSDNQAAFQLKSFRTNYLQGSLELFLNDKRNLSAVISENEEITTYTNSISLKDASAISLLKGVLNSGSQNKEMQKMLLITNGAVKAYTEETDQITSYVLENGVIKIKAAPSFYPGLYSLKLENREWFDHSFPERIAKGWWNPWAGGMKTIPSKLNSFSLMKGESIAEFIDLEDNRGNVWKSLAIHTKIINHDIWKGLQYTQYFAILPGVPVMAYFVQVKDSGGKSLIGETWNTDIFIKGDSLNDLSVTTSENTDAKKYFVGKEEQLLFMKKGSYISSENRQEKMYLVEGTDSQHLECYMNKEVFQVNNIQKSTEKTKPGFIIFDERIISESILRDLSQIEF